MRKRNFLPSRRSSRSLWSRFPRSVLRETTEDELLFCLQWWKMMSNERRPNTWQFIPPANQTSSMFPLMTIRTGNLPLYSIKSRVNNCIARWGLSEWKGLKKPLVFSLFFGQAALFHILLSSYSSQLMILLLGAHSRNTFRLCRKKTEWRTELPEGFACYISSLMGTIFAGTARVISCTHHTEKYQQREKTSRRGGWKKFATKIQTTKETLHGTESVAISTPDLVQSPLDATLNATVLWLFLTRGMGLRVGVC